MLKLYFIYIKKNNNRKEKKIKFIMGIGDWGLGIGDWGLGSIFAKLL